MGPHPGVLKVNRPHRQHGISLVETLVGLSIGLGVVALMLTTWSDHLRQSRALRERARLQHDLQVVANLIVQELRRSGFSPAQATSPSPAGNPFGPIDTSATGVTYRWDRNGNGTLDEEETLNINWNEGRVRLRVGSGTSQELNDPGVVFVNHLSITTTQQNLSLAAQCHAACLDTSSTCLQPPEQIVRQVRVALEGRPASGHGAAQQVTADMRVGNDLVQGACPS